MAPDEAAFETLLLRLWPGVREQCVGASPDDIQELEELSEQRLPPFYRWFLQKMGQDLGSFRFPRLDFTISTIMSKYESGVVSVDPRYLLIAWDSDRAMPNHLFYDLEAEVRDDALVVQRHVDGAIIANQFETLREMLAWRTLLRYGVEMSACVCVGRFTSDSEPVSRLTPALKALGFETPVPTGNFCGLHERKDAAMVFSVTPMETPPPFVFFRLGGATEGLLRQILGTIGYETGIRVKIDRWFLDNLNPP
jgi:hypothetical protein